jgi:hypothetical protein
MSAGLLVVQLKYRLYVDHLSKWFVFFNSFMFYRLFMVALSFFRLAYNGLQLPEGRDFYH